MLTLIFSAQRRIIKFVIFEKVVKYFDDNWKEGIQIYPLDKLFVRKLTLSRKPSLSAMGLLIIEANSGKNLEEYKKCKSEEKLAEKIREDCKLKGLVELGDK